jgi:5-methylcytosine-specific restriction endonuclease McrA
VLLGKGKAELLSNGRGELHTPSTTIIVPSVIRLGHLVVRPFSPRKFSRREVFARDSYTCQYCGKQTRNLTLDHVKPRRQGGQHCWENVVSACIPCNHRKAGRTPEQASMKLHRPPKAPPASPYHILQTRPLQDEWLEYIPWAMR